MSLDPRTFQGINVLRIYSNFCFIGIHAHRKEDLIFKKLFFRIDNLEPWFGKSAFKTDHGKNFDTLKITLNHLPKKQCRIRKDLWLELSSSASIPFLSGWDNRVELEQKIYFILKSRKHFHYEEWAKLIRALEDFISLAAQRDSGCNEIFGFSKFSQEVTESGQKYLNQVRIYQLTSKKDYVEKEIHPLDLLFRFDDMGKEWGNYFANWLNKKERLFPARLLFQLGTESRHKAVEKSFIYMIQAVETFHRHFKRGKYLDKQNFESKVLEPLQQFVATNVKGDLRQKIQSSLFYMNEYSLRRRLKSLMKKNRRAIKAVINNEEQIISELVNWRNAFTHFDDYRIFGRIDVHKLGALSDVAAFIAVVYILRTTGFSAKDVHRMVARNRKFKQLKMVLAEQYPVLKLS